MLGKSPFSILEKTVRVLIADDDPVVLKYLNEMISGHQLLDVNIANSSRKAEEVICDWKPHICLMDLGLNDIDFDEYYLLKKFSKIIPFIIISATNDIERAFMAASIGVAGMIAKPPDFYSINFWNLLQDAFLGKCILPIADSMTNTVFYECCKVLQIETPENVADWANKVGITDAYLRKIWTEYHSTSPKHILFIYKLYNDVFCYYNQIFLSELVGNEINHILFHFEESYRRAGYYLMNRHTFEVIRDKQSQRLQLIAPIP